MEHDTRKQTLKFLSTYHDRAKIKAAYEAFNNNEDALLDAIDIALTDIQLRRDLTQFITDHARKSRKANK